MWLLNKNKKYQSKINGKIYIGKRTGKKALFSGGVTQSGGELIEMWDSVSERIKEDLPNAKNCLVLGVAGGTFISSIVKTVPKIKIIGIELDKTMIDVYYDQFNNTKSKIKIINDDATIWVKTTDKSFDIILVDLYIGRLNPINSRNKEFLKDLLLHLTKKGIVIYNSHFDKNNPNEFEQFEKLVKTYYYSEVIYEFPLNKVLLLTQRESRSKNLKNKL